MTLRLRSGPGRTGRRIAPAQNPAAFGGRTAPLLRLPRLGFPNSRAAAFHFAPADILSRPKVRADAALSLRVMGRVPEGSRRRDGLKRAADIGIALLSLPIVLICGAVLIMLNPLFNPGPLFFVQTRVGRNGHSFSMIKFRSMVGIPRTLAFAPAEAARIRPLGRWLRRVHLDELPQAFNILRGEMSLVGPRPERPAFVARYSAVLPGYARRHLVRPGLTGLAQVALGYTTTLEETHRKLAFDLSYIQTATFGRDMRLLWRTAVVILRGRR